MFIINLVPLHVFVLLLMGRYSNRWVGGGTEEEGEEKDKGEEKRRGLWQRGGGGCGKRERSERDANFNSSTIVMR